MQIILPEEDKSYLPVAPMKKPDVDLRIIDTWVSTKSRSRHTQRAFRLEARRWLAWLMWQKRGIDPTSWLEKALSEDAANYALFLVKENKPHFPPDVLWAAELSRQPFMDKKLAPASVDRAIEVLKSMYSELIGMVTSDELNLRKNPFAPFNASSFTESSSRPRDKALTAQDRQYVEAALEEYLVKATSPRGIARYHQRRWIWKALLHSAMRRSEFAAARAGDIYLDTDEEGQRVWKITIKGKGNKVASIPLSSHFMAEFAAYRQFHELSPVPIHGEDNQPDNHQLVIPVNGEPRQVSDMLIYRSMKKLLLRASKLAQLDDNPTSAAQLIKSASHTARHTCVTRIVDETGDITLAMDMARHASITTTQTYVAQSTARLKRALENLS